MYLRGWFHLMFFFSFFFQLVDSDVYFGAGLFVDFSCILDLCLFSCIVCL